MIWVSRISPIKQKRLVSYFIFSPSKYCPDLIAQMHILRDL